MPTIRTRRSAIGALAALLALAPVTLGESDSAPPVGRFEIVPASHAAYLIESDRASVIDTRPVAKYLASHVPGAVHLDDECLRASVSGLPAQYLESCDLGRLFERAGISADRPVIVYADGEDPLAATMAAYALLKAGHQRVLLLDGGFESWRGNNAVTQTYAAFDTTPWAGAPVDTLAASLGDAKGMSESREGEIVDARPARLFRGDGHAWARNGHIPGATSLDWTSLMRADNQAAFKPRAEIEKLLKDAGLDSRTPTIVYCGTGREATLLFTYLRGVLEWPRVTLYEGSWTEWSAHPELAVATGDDDAPAFTADGDVLIGGQPTAAQLREFADRGVTTIVNCRTPGESARVDFSESALAAKLGIRYVEIPLGGNEGYDPRDVDALTSALADRADSGTTLIHCASGGRASQLWLAHLVTDRGMTLDDAQAHLRALGILHPQPIERLTTRTSTP